MSDSTELAVVDPAELAKLAALTGADPNANRGPRTPQLKVNTDDEDADGRELPRGQMYLTDQETTVYSKTVNIRVLGQYFMYSDYDGENNKQRNQTLMVTSFQEELLDETGTVRCGRPGGAAWKEMDAAARKQFEDITAFRILHVLVSYTGKTATGETVTVENVPAVLRLKGANFMGFEDEFTKALPAGRNMWDFQAEVSLERKKNGSVTYYVMHYKPDLSNPLPITMPVVDTIKHFAAMKEDHNKRVMEKHKAALAKRNGDDAVYDAVGGDLESDFQD